MKFPTDKPQNSEVKDNLERFFESKLPGNFEDYTRVGSKLSGVSQGFEAELNTKRYYLKRGLLNPQNEAEIYERNDVLYEFMAIPERFLYDQSPIISAVSLSKSPKDRIYLRSKKS